MNYTKIFIQQSGMLTFLVVSMILAVQFLPVKAFAGEEKKATIQLSFDQNDSTKICKAKVIADNKPVKGVEVHFYVKRMYSLLAIGKAISTDSSGMAIAKYPIDLPGDKEGNLTAIAKIEDDDNYGNAETSADVKWGVVKSEANDKWFDRSLSASRDKAPMILIIVSNLIIALIWGTICYVVFQVFRIKKESLMLRSKK